MTMLDPWARRHLEEERRRRRGPVVQRILDLVAGVQRMSGQRPQEAPEPTPAPRPAATPMPGATRPVTKPTVDVMYARARELANQAARARGPDVRAAQQAAYAYSPGAPVRTLQRAAYQGLTAPIEHEAVRAWPQAPMAYIQRWRQYLFDQTGTTELRDIPAEYHRALVQGFASAQAAPEGGTQVALPEQLRGRGRGVGIGGAIMSGLRRIPGFPRAEEAVGRFGEEKVAPQARQAAVAFLQPGIPREEAEANLPGFVPGPLRRVYGRVTEIGTTPAVAVGAVISPSMLGYTVAGSLGAGVGGEAGRATGIPGAEVAGELAGGFATPGALALGPRVAAGGVRRLVTRAPAVAEEAAGVGVPSGRVALGGREKAAITRNLRRAERELQEATALAMEQGRDPVGTIFVQRAQEEVNYQRRAQALARQGRPAAEVYGLSPEVAPIGTTPGAIGTREEVPAAVRAATVIETPAAPASSLAGQTPAQPPVRPVVATEAELPRIAGGTSTSYAGELRPLTEVAEEVVTSANPLVRLVVGKTGLNPSVLQNTPIGRLLVAYQRHLVAADELTEVALQAGLDTHAQRFTGRLGGVIPIDREGLMHVTEAATGKTRKVPWQDVFSRPDKWVLKPETRAYVDDYLRVVDDAEALRVLNGLKTRATRSEEGWFYVPRQVREVRGIELRRPSSPALRRLYEEAEEGFANGVRYSTDPRATLRLHLRNAYNEVIEAQLSQAVEPLSIVPKQLIKEPVLRRMTEATIGRIRAERAVRRARAALVAEGRTGAAGRDVSGALRSAGVRGKTGAVRGAVAASKATRRTQLRAALSSAEADLKAAMAEYNAAKVKYSAALASAKKSEIAPAPLFGRGEGEISIRQWRNRFLPAEDYDKLTDGLRLLYGRAVPKPSVMARAFQVLGNTIRFLASVGDFALPFTHGLPVLGRDPRAWAVGSLRHYQAFFDPTVQARFMRDHLATFQKMAAHGTPVGDPEFFAALRTGEGLSPGRLLEFLPKGKEARLVMQQAGRQTFGRFQSSFSMGLGTYRAMLTEAMGASWRGTDSELQAFIRNLTGGLDSRALGVGPTQRGIESMWLGFSPRLLRSTAALVGDLRYGLTTDRGRNAWRSLATLASAVTGVYVLTGIGLGKSWEEIGEGLNPLNGKRYLSHNINGDWIGVGGQVRAITQLLARSAADPKSLASVSQAENPLINFYSTRGAVGVSMGGGIVEAATGQRVNVLPFENIDSLPDLAKHLATSALPFTLQGRLQGEQPLTSLFAVGGLRTSPQTPYEALNTAAQQRFGRGYSELLGTEKEQIKAALPGEATQMEREQEARASAGDVSAQYYQRVKEVNADYNERITQAAESIRSDAEFRLWFQDIQRERRGALRSVETDPRFVDVIAEQKDRDAKALAEARKGPRDTAYYLAEYGAIFDRHENEAQPGAPGGLFEDLDLFWSQLTPAQQAAVREQLGLRLPDRARKMQAELTKLRKYWEQGDLVWTAMRQRYAQLAAYDDPQSYRAAVEAAIRQRGLLGRLTADQDPIVRLYNDAVGEARRRYRLKNPSIEAILLRWGYVSRGTSAAAIQYANEPELVGVGGP